MLSPKRRVSNKHAATWISFFFSYSVHVQSSKGSQHHHCQLPVTAGHPVKVRYLTTQTLFLLFPPFISVFIYLSSSKSTVCGALLSFQPLLLSSTPSFVLLLLLLSSLRSPLLSSYHLLTTSTIPLLTTHCQTLSLLCISAPVVTLPWTGCFTEPVSWGARERPVEGAELNRVLFQHVMASLCQRGRVKTSQYKIRQCRWTHPLFSYQSTVLHVLY